MVGVIVAAAEALHFVWCRRKLDDVSAPAWTDTNLERLTADGRQQTFSHCLSHGPAPGGVEGVRRYIARPCMRTCHTNLYRFVRGWFFDAEWDSLTRGIRIRLPRAYITHVLTGDIDGWLAWGLFSRRADGKHRLVRWINAV